MQSDSPQQLKQRPFVPINGGGYMNKVVWYLLVIVVTDTIREWLWQLWNHTAGRLMGLFEKKGGDGCGQ